MRRTYKSLLGWCVAGCLWLAIAAPPSVWPLRAAEPQELENPWELETEVTDVGVPHAECSFFTAQREKILASAIGAGSRALWPSSSLSTTGAAASPARTLLSGRSRSASTRMLARDGFIDRYTFAAMATEGVAPAPRTIDSEFLRRVTLDLTGRIPTADEVLSFLSDTSGGKRTQAIDRLLTTPQWADRWAMFFGDLFRNTTVTAQVNRYPNGRDAFHLYLRDSLRENKPYDQMAREMLASAGTSDGRTYPEEFSSYEQYLSIINDYEGNPVTPTPASYIVGALTRGGPIHDTYDTMSVNLARDFLGIAHMDCILCHDGSGRLDSLSVWGGQAKRSEVWQLSAFFARTGLRRPRRIPPPPEGEERVRPRWWTVFDITDAQAARIREGGEYSLDTTTGNRPERLPAEHGAETVVDPAYPFGGGTPLGGETRREAIGRLLTADIQFSRAIVNYVWREFFSRGIVEPPDQFDLGRLDPDNPPPDPWRIQPSHPRLLQELAEKFRDSGFDLKWLMREIATSRLYQLSSRYEGDWNPGWEPLFARHQARRLGAEQIHDALLLSSGVPQPYGISRAIGRVNFAMQFPDVQNTPRGPRQRDAEETPAAAASSLLDAFLRGDREETSRSSEPTIIQALHMMNSSLVLHRTDAHTGQGYLPSLLEQPDENLVASLYVLVLSRFPSPVERAAGLAALSGGNRTEAAEDLMWSLYNKIDFIFNY